MSLALPLTRGDHANEPVRKLGAYLIDAKTQRVSSSKALTLAMVTLSTALCCFAFVMVDGTFAIMVSTMGVSLTSTVCPSLEFEMDGMAQCWRVASQAMWAILYGWVDRLQASGRCN